MKRKMSMLLAIILVTTSFIGCNQTPETPIATTTSPTVEDTTQEDILDESDDISDIEEDATTDDIADIEEDTAIDDIAVIDDIIEEQQITKDIIDETVMTSDNTDHLEQETIQLNDTDFEIITTDTITGETSSLLVSSPPPTTSDVPPSTSTNSDISTPTDNVDYNLHITTSDGMVLDNANIRISMSAIFPENIVPSTGDFMTSGPTISNPITDGVTTFSVPDMRTISTYDYKLYIIIDIGKPFSISTPTVGRIPSVNGSIYTNSIALDFDINDTDLYITITDESNI